MYYDYEGYLKHYPHSELTPEEYSSRALQADYMINNITLDRVKRAVDKGQELPDIIEEVYYKIVNELDAFNGDSERVTSFSNGVDSYSFDVTKTDKERIYEWAVELLPIEWCSVCVSYEGGYESESR